MLLDLDRATSFAWYADSPTEYHTSPRRYTLEHTAGRWWLRDDDSHRIHTFDRATTRTDLPDAVAEVLARWQAEDTDKPREAADGVITLPGVTREP